MKYSNYDDSIFHEGILLKYYNYNQGVNSMAVSLNSIIKEMMVFNPKLYISQDNGIPVQAVKLLETDQVVFEPEYLYIGSVLNFPKSIPYDILVNILCVTEDICFDLNPKYENLNLIIIPHKIELASIFNRIQSVFLNQQQIQLKHEELIDTFIHGKGLQDIIYTGYKLLKNPIILIDSSSKLLAYSGSIEVKDVFWNDLVLNGYFSYESVSMIEAKKINHIVNSNAGPVYIGKEIFSVARLISKIVMDNKTVGSIAILEYEKPFSENDIVLFKLLSDIISSEMGKKDLSKTQRDIYMNPLLLKFLMEKKSILKL